MSDCGSRRLGPGTYWIEGSIVGPENNFWLTADEHGNECWAYYSDFGFNDPGSKIFDVPSDITWALLGRTDGNVCSFVESFDAYAYGSIIVPQGDWEAWDDDPARANGIVTSAQSSTPIHSSISTVPTTSCIGTAGSTPVGRRYAIWP